MADVLDRFARLHLTDWMALYAAILSTVTVAVQIMNARRDRADIRVRMARRRPNVPDAAKRLRFFEVNVANIGIRPLPIFRPQLRIIRKVGTSYHTFYDSPTEEYDDYHGDWVGIEQQEPEEAFELQATESRWYRFTIPKTTKVLALRVVDRAGVTRYRRRMLFSVLHRAVFFVRNVVRTPRQPQNVKTAKKTA